MSGVDYAYMLGTRYGRLGLCKEAGLTKAALLFLAPLALKGALGLGALWAGKNAIKGGAKAIQSFGKGHDLEALGHAGGAAVNTLSAASGGTLGVGIKSVTGLAGMARAGAGKLVGKAWAPTRLGQAAAGIDKHMPWMNRAPNWLRNQGLKTTAFVHSPGIAAQNAGARMGYNREQGEAWQKFMTEQQGLASGQMRNYYNGTDNGHLAGVISGRGGVSDASRWKSYEALRNSGYYQYSPASQSYSVNQRG